MTDIDTTWQRIDDWLSRNAPEVFQGLRPGATEEQMAATEQTLGITFPEDVRKSYGHHDGKGLDPMLGWGNRVRMRDGQVLFIVGNEPDPQVFGGGRTRDDFLAVERAFGVSWDYSTLDEEPEEDEEAGEEIDQ